MSAGQRRALGADHTVRAAVVGTGAVAHLHAAAVAADPRARLVAVCDPDSARRAGFAREHAVPGVHPDLDALLSAEDVDVVHLCSPPQTHREQVRAAARAGVHVVCEKPPALSLSELDDMERTCEAAGVAFAVVFQQRTGSAAAHARSLLASGALGRPLLASCSTLWHRGADYYAVDWRGRWDSEGGGTTLTHGIHQLDLLAHLLGDWEEVEARTWRLARDIETEDVSTATILFAAGTLATAVSSVLSPRQTSHVRIDCERATIEVEHLYGHDRSSWRLTPTDDVPAAEAAGWAFPEEDVPSGHEPLVAATYRALREGAALPEVATAARRPLELVTAVYASADLGRPVSAQELRHGDLLATGLRSRVRDPRPER